MSTWTAFRPAGIPHPFSLSIHDDNWVMVSGLGGHDETGNISEDFEEQARAAIAKLSAFLEQGGSSLAEVVYFRALLTTRDYLPDLDPIIEELLPTDRPAAGALIICELADPRMKVEFEAWAHRGATVRTTP